MKISLYPKALLAVMLLFGCTAPKHHFITPDGRPLQEMDYLWEMVDKVFPEALPHNVTLVWVNTPHSSFMIESDSIGIPLRFKSHIRRGKICRELTHLALHYLSGGEPNNRGKCFDNDVVFLEQAIAGYMDRKGTGLLEEGVESSGKTAARLFRSSEMTLLGLRDWETFFWRGRWSDQYKEWNLEGLEALVSLGDYLERSYGLSTFAPVFESLAEGTTLDRAVREVLLLDIEQLLNEWQDDVLARHPEESAVPEVGDKPSD